METALGRSNLSKTQLRQQILEKMPYTDTAPNDNDNLLELGLDSMSIMQLLDNWRSSGHHVTFIQLVETPTLSAWHELLS